jgi:GNAT superfamily N-acetyltransferase
MAIETTNSPIAPLPIVQTEADNILWSQLVTELSRQYEAALKVVFPAELNEHTYAWFRAIEDYNFRSELRYSIDEMKPILAKPELLFLFVFKDELPEIVVLGYTNPGEPERVFRLDTFAINKRGKGIGHIVMDFLIKWARAKQYAAIELDTEETDEKGIKLQRFYEKHRFVVVARDAKGDLTMRCTLSETSPAAQTAIDSASTTPTESPPVNPAPASTPPPSMPPAAPPPAEMPPVNTLQAEAPSMPTIPSPVPISPTPIDSIPTVVSIAAAVLSPTAPPTTAASPVVESEDKSAGSAS